MKGIKIALLALIAFALFVPSSGARPVTGSHHGDRGPVLYASAGFGSELIKIDIGTGHVTSVGYFGVFALSLAISPKGKGKFFTTTDSYCPPGMGWCSSAGPQLASVDRKTGLATPFGVSGEPFMGIGFSPEGTLYGVNAESGTPDQGSLYRFDLATGEATKVGETGGCFDIMDLAWAPDGKMYGAAYDSLYRINEHTGKAKLVTKIYGLAEGAVMGLAIDDQGDFYVSEIVENASLFRLNPKTGALKQIHLDRQVDLIHGLEIMQDKHGR